MPAPSETSPRDHDVRPVPDPTILTTEQLRRELAGLREILEARMSGGDRTVNMLKEAIDKMPLQIESSVSHLRILHEEKFHSIATQFAERDTRTEQTAKDSKVAVDAALQAAKEAVGEQNKSSALAIAKSEGATTKQIDLLGESIGALQKNQDDKIGDLKDRINIIDGRTEGSKGTKEDGRANMAILIAAITAVVAIASGIYATTHVSTSTGSINPTSVAPAVVTIPAQTQAPQIIVVPAQPATPTQPK